MNNLSLYVIEESLQILMETYEAAEIEGDSEALKLIDQQLAEYVNTREPAKVASYVAAIHTREDITEACDRELSRIGDIKRRAVNGKARMLANALGAMQRFDVKELRATPGGGLRRQANGGVQPLDIPMVDHLPEDMKLYSVRMTGQAYGYIRQLCADAEQVIMVLDTASSEANTAAIRSALKQRVVCPECNGDKVHEVADGAVEYACARCNAEGTIPATVPGVKLLPRGEHVRVI